MVLLSGSGSESEPPCVRRPSLHSFFSGRPLRFSRVNLFGSNCSFLLFPLGRHCLSLRGNRWFHANDFMFCWIFHVWICFSWKSSFGGKKKTWWICRRKTDQRRRPVFSWSGWVQWRSVDPDFSVECVDDGFHPELKVTLLLAFPGSWFAPFWLQWASRVFSGASLLKNQRLTQAFVLGQVYGQFSAKGSGGCELAVSLRQQHWRGRGLKSIQLQHVKPPNESQPSGVMMMRKSLKTTSWRTEFTSATWQSLSFS